MASNGVSNFKIELVGDSDVGKTSILHRYMYNTFLEKTSKHLFGEERKKLTINGKETILEIWDTACREYYQASDKTFNPSCFREPDAAILVYSVVEEESFRNLLDYWLNQTRLHDYNMPILLVGNKKDLWDSSDEHVSFDTVQEYAETHNLMHPLECSAKTGDNIHRIFHLVASELYEKCMKNEIRRSTNGKERKPVQNKNSKSCCCS